jgi:tetratricopeptide (TPR) repeat protein
MSSNSSRDAAAFVSGSPELQSALLALAAAESLTDDTARLLIEIATEGLDSDRVIRALHVCDFVLERNSEWQFAVDVRKSLLPQLIEHRSLAASAHDLLLRLAIAPEDELRGLEMPRYLRNAAGRAYHRAFLAPAEALPAYAAIAVEPLSGQVWLASELAREQQWLGVLPPDALQVDFLVGMVLYKEHRQREAEPFLRRVARNKAMTLEVAIAAHLVGRMDARDPRRRVGAERLLRRSLTILTELRDRFGEAQVLHTLGQLIGRDTQRRAEAEELLRHSLTILTELRDRFGEAQVLHTLGQLIGRDMQRRAEAEELLQRSLAIGIELHNRSHEAQVLRTLGLIYVSVDRSRAVVFLLRSLAVNRAAGNAAGMRIVERDLRNLGVDPEAGEA